MRDEGGALKSSALTRTRHTTKIDKHPQTNALTRASTRSLTHPLAHLHTQHYDLDQVVNAEHQASSPPAPQHKPPPSLPPFLSCTLNSLPALEAVKLCACKAD